MTEMPNKLTLIAMAGAMETLHAMRIESPKDRYTPDDAAALCSLAPMTVLFFGGEAPAKMQYVHPAFTTHLSDADIARIADAVRPAPGFTGGEVFGKMPATGPFPLPGQIYTDPMPIWTSSGNTDADGHRRIDGVGEKKDGE